MTIATVWSMTAESKYVTWSKMKLRQMGASKEDFTKETKALKWKQTSSLQHSSLGNRAREQRMISKYLTRKETIHLSLLKARHVLAIAKALYSDLIHGIVSSILRTLSFECKTGSSFWQRYPFRPKSTFGTFNNQPKSRIILPKRNDLFWFDLHLVYAITGWKPPQVDEEISTDMATISQRGFITRISTSASSFLMETWSS